MPETRTFEYTIIEIEGAPLYVIRVPDELLGDPLRLGEVLRRAGTQLTHSPVVAVGLNTGKIVGNLDWERHLHGVDLQAVYWRPWNMVA